MFLSTRSLVLRANLTRHRLLHTTTASYKMGLNSSEMQVSNFVSGLTSPENISIDALKIGSFAAVREGHPPPGTMPESILPEGAQKPLLFTPLTMPVARPNGSDRMTFKNRVVVSPMCQYSANNGMPSHYHLAHLGQFALHGAGSIIVEASAVVPEGRITPQDLGLWSEEHRDAHKALVSGLKSFTDGLAVGVQLAHAGRKASSWSPFHRGARKEHNYVTAEEGGWPDNVVAPEAITYDEKHVKPRALTTAEIRELEDAFVQSARWAFEAGYDLIELHGAHGYLLHSFLSPLTSGGRTDEYGGASLENRCRMLTNIVKRIRSEFPNKGLWVRVSSTDWVQDESKGPSWTVDQTVELGKILHSLGVDLMDVSSAGLVPYQKITAGPGYQLFGAKAVRDAMPQNDSRMLVGAVGMMEGSTSDANAHDVSQAGLLAEESLHTDCDAVLLARGLLANPKWPEDAAAALTGVRCAGNPQYHRVHPAKKPSTTYA